MKRAGAFISSVMEGEPCFSKSSAVSTSMGSAASSAAPEMYEPVTTTISISDTAAVSLRCSCAELTEPCAASAMATALMERKPGPRSILRVDMEVPVLIQRCTLIFEPASPQAGSIMRQCF